MMPICFLLTTPLLFIAASDIIVTPLIYCWKTLKANSLFLGLWKWHAQAFVKVWQPLSCFKVGIKEEEISGEKYFY